MFLQLQPAFQLAMQHQVVKKNSCLLYAMCCYNLPHVVNNNNYYYNTNIITFMHIRMRQCFNTVVQLTRCNKILFKIQLYILIFTYNVGYRYGKTLVPLTKIDRDSMKLPTERCLSVLCFASNENVS